MKNFLPAYSTQRMLKFRHRIDHIKFDVSFAWWCLQSKWNFKLNSLRHSSSIIIELPFRTFFILIFYNFHHHQQLWLSISLRSQYFIGNHSSVNVHACSHYSQSYRKLSTMIQITFATFINPKIGFIFLSLSLTYSQYNFPIRKQHNNPIDAWTVHLI